MRISLSLAALVSGLTVICTSGSLAHGQAAPAPRAASSGTNIAVVDVAYIFKKHDRFKQAMEGMKKDVEAAEVQLKKAKSDIQGIVERLQQFQAGSPDYKSLEAQITKLQADFNVKASLQKKDFLERESKIYFNVYREIDDSVKVFAQHNDIGIVFRFNGDEIDSNDRNEILRGINKPIVYYDRSLDITKIILDDLNRSAAATGPRPAGGTAVGVRPRPQSN